MTIPPDFRTNSSRILSIAGRWRIQASQDKFIRCRSLRRFGLEHNRRWRHPYFRELLSLHVRSSVMQSEGYTLPVSAPILQSTSTLETFPAQLLITTQSRPCRSQTGTWNTGPRRSEDARVSCSDTPKTVTAQGTMRGSIHAKLRSGLFLLLLIQSNNSSMAEVTRSPSVNQQAYETQIRQIGLLPPMTFVASHHPSFSNALPSCSMGLSATGLGHSVIPIPSSSASPCLP